ncbi:SDR family oxidoreductase [Saccharopolyspora sp. K220]|uniref:SDR family oxidoreductase n=1 Tax=Saccharopolyspora soli TaxID=2926618 RepID=UPI001F56103F|nr:SDR family oxidoreductase [Saccharopolyspora soli]MCI2416139.1 SDR family oxidoreductase [Saccharopolyspora soli]
MPERNELRGKLALVTGGARGVGKAIAAALAARGAHVIVNYFHSHEQAKQTRAELSGIDLIRASVARPDQVAGMFAEIDQRYGRLDILVNNAANGALVADDEVTDAQLDKGWDTNVKGALRCSEHAAELMRRQGGGAIVNVSTLGASQFVMANYLACAPAKAAVEALTRYLAARFAPDGIRVNTASAAMLVSDVADAFPQAEQMQQAVRAATPFNRLGTPAELADLVAFLAGDDSRWITGQAVVADGGLSLGVPLLSAPPSEPAPVAATDGDESEVDEVAVVGMGMAVAGANSPAEFWQLRQTGAELFVPVPADRWDRDSFHSSDEHAEDKAYQDRCVFITDFRSTDEHSGDQEFTTRWLRHSVVQAMREVSTQSTDRFRCIFGYTPDGNQHLEEAGVFSAAVQRSDALLAELDPESPEALRDEVRRTLADRYRRGDAPETGRFLPHRVGRLAIDGVLPATTSVQMVDTACSSSLYAVDIGAKALLSGSTDVAVCGGAFALGPRGTVLFSKLRGLSKRGEVRSLDKDADGVIFADGAAVVVLKRLSRARADGDQVLAVLRSTGTSSDGRGKAIYAPNPEGQARAIARACAAEPPDWIIAHATGTPAGDLAELNTLHDRYGQGAGSVPVTSNKSLIGHTGWAAGVVSLIEAILGMRHEVVPPQFRFNALTSEFAAAGSALHIPTQAHPLPAREDRQRKVAVTGFGFGGTNAHLIIAEPPRESIAPTTDDGHPRRRIAIVGWSAHLPGLADRAAIAAWLRGREPGPSNSFGEQYPAPPFSRVRLPPPTVRTVDRCQLMALECGHQLREQLGDAWQQHAERTGVFVGHLGPTRNGMLYANRCYLDDIGKALTGNPVLAESDLLPKLLHGLREHAHQLVPPSNEDSFSGIMPNIISARVANYFDLHGPNLTLDAGLASTLAAFEVAAGYLRAGEIDVALVGGINGNGLAEFRPMIGDLVPGPDLAEGAFLFALAGEDIAEATGLQVLGWLDDIAPSDTTSREEIECGVPAQENARYLGGAGGLAVLKHLLTGSGAATVVCQGESDTPATRLDVTVPASTDQQCQVRRHVAELRPEAREPSLPGTPFLPRGVVLLTDRPELIDALGALPEGARVLCCAPEMAPRPGWHHLPEVTPDAVDSALAGHRSNAVRGVVDLTSSVPPETCLSEGSAQVDALHDMMFLVMQRALDASVITLLLGALPEGVPHPYHGLFSGLMKAAHLESPDAVRFVLATDERDAAAGLRVVERESRVRRALPVVFYDRGERQVYRLSECPAELPEPVPARFGPESVVVAIGGARGITAELLKVLAEQFRVRLHLVGSNPLDSYPAEVFAASDDEFASRRKGWLREQMVQRPGTPVAQLNREYDRMVEARQARQNIAEMSRSSGAVHYRACDVTDPHAVQRLVDDIIAAESKIDLLINAAGRSSSTRLERKDFAEFRRVRDVKLLAHRNLKRALAGRQVGTWCNFGSLLGFFGQVGETDYASANDFLAAAGEFSARVAGADELTIGWTLWGGTGMGAGGLISKYYERSATYSNMSVSEGVHHFLRELHAPVRDPHTVHLGEAERSTVTHFYPDFFDSDEVRGTRDRVTGARVPRTAPDDFYLRRAVSEEDDSLLCECPMDLVTDGYLRGHLVRGHPTLPGLFVVELAAEAALRLRPDREVVGYQDVRFDRFIQVRDDMPTQPKRIRATVLDSTDDLVTVEVRITSDIVSQGILAARDKPHFSCRVLLAPQFASMRWQPWRPDAAERAVPDPYHLPGSPVALTGPFACTSDTRLHPLGKRARFTPDLADADLVWSAFTMPNLLLDGMARMGVLHLVDGRLMPVAVPTAIRRIDLYQRANDRALAESGPVELYASPPEVTFGTRQGNRFVAARPDGRTLAQIKDIRAKVLGHIDIATGNFHTAGGSNG